MHCGSVAQVTTEVEELRAEVEALRHEVRFLHYSSAVKTATVPFQVRPNIVFGEGCNIAPEVRISAVDATSN